MEMKKLHMGTMSFGYDTMDEVAHQLSTAFGAESELILPNIPCVLVYLILCSNSCEARLVFYWRTVGYSGPPRHVCACP